ncbi:MAG: pitrilysin family protein [Alphaproteobacteria bacterium]|nr:pitrilysin family protein [Alphaproteobacteria bacterium]MDP6812895.1 pitrilysin family protein [Alphaproteobacteria bacterium]
MSVEISTLKNGLRVVSDARPGFETAAVGVWVDAGARYENPDNNGVAHMLEHMAFKGTKSRSASDIAIEIESVGGHLNAYTSREHTAYFARVLRDDVPLSVDILGDILQRSTFAEVELARERTVVIQEIGQSEDTPDDIIFDRLQEAAFPDQALGRSILGPAAGITVMARQTLFDFMAEHYGGARLLLCAVGAVEHEGLLALAEAQFADLPAGRAGSFEVGDFAGGDRRDLRDLEQVHIAMALPGLPYEDDDFYPLQVMSTVLGGGMSSRLFQEVRENRGLCYSVFSFASSYKDCGSFGVYAGTGEEQIAELVPVICDEMMRLAGDAGDDEVARARNQLKAGTLMSLENTPARAEQLARQMLIFGRPIPLSEITAKIDAVDAAAVRRVAERVATAGAPALAAMGPISALASHDEIAARFSKG